jgi:hypothetical protein
VSTHLGDSFDYVFTHGELIYVGKFSIFTSKNKKTTKEKLFWKKSNNLPYSSSTIM